MYIKVIQNMLTFPGCTDDNECTLDLHHCDPVNAECRNTNGSYECSCKTGFDGDGFECHVRSIILVSNESLINGGSIY